MTRLEPKMTSTHTLSQLRREAEALTPLRRLPPPPPPLAPSRRGSTCAAAAAAALAALVLAVWRVLQ